MPGIVFANAGHGYCMAIDQDGLCRSLVLTCPATGVFGGFRCLFDLELLAHSHCVRREIVHALMDSQLKPIGKQLPQHRPQRFGSGIRRSCGDDVESLRIEPVRTADDAIGIEGPGGLNQIHHRGVA